MKRIFTLLSFVFAVALSYAGTPVINGVYDGAEGWGSPVGTGDGIAGWSNANAKKLYITHDDTYVYFGMECTAENWQQFILAVNTKDGGNSTDPWGRTITYGQTNPPDFLFRGNVTGDNYAEFHVWNGSAWTGTGVNINSAGHELKGVFDGSNNGFIELRVPVSVIGSDHFDVEFIIGGNNGGISDGHGCFDAIPNDDNCTGWSFPNNASTVVNYISNILLPVKFESFSGVLSNHTANLTWKTGEEATGGKFIVQQSVDGNSWKSAATVFGTNKVSGDIYNYSVLNVMSAVTLFRIKLIEATGNVLYSKSIILTSAAGAGFTLLTNPVKDVIKLGINIDTKAVVNASLMSINGARITNKTIWHPGGNSMMEIKASGLAKGTYILQVNTGKLRQSFKVIIQ